MKYYTISAIQPEHSTTFIHNNLYGSYDIKEVREEIQDMKDSGGYTNITMITTTEDYDQAGEDYNYYDSVSESILNGDNDYDDVGDPSED